MRTGSRAGYWIVEWTEDWDPSLKDLIDRFPEIVVGRYVAIASCDSGPYRPTDADIKTGWEDQHGITISQRISKVSQLPMPGFDEWYVYDNSGALGHCRSFVNHFGFAPLDASSGLANAFWAQVEACRPLHVLGAGTPTMFFVTRDEALFKRVTNA
jgi:hypothetical protein